MKQKGKRLVTAFLSVAFIFSMSAVSAYADDNKGISEYDTKIEHKNLDSTEPFSDNGRRKNSFEIDSSQITAGKIGVEYSAKLSTEGDEASKWEVVDGNLPNGLALVEDSG